MKMDVLIEAFRIDVARDIVALEQRFDLAGEDDALAVVVVVDLFHAERIAHEQ